jgi:AcrR family transcriptional regulator
VTRALLSGSSSYTAFTVDAVAKHADVARATVYYQFESKAGLLEAICDAIAAEGRLSDLELAFTEPDPVRALQNFIGCFARFWYVDRLAMRRLRALAVLDPDVAHVIEQRDQRRLEGLEVLVARLAASAGRRQSAKTRELVRILHTLTSFETFDSLDRDDLPLPEVTQQMVDLVTPIVENFREG